MPGPGWAQALGWTAGAIIAVGIIWTKALNPIRKGTNVLEEFMPIGRKLVAVYGGEPELLEVNKDMAAQFDGNGSSTLRDVLEEVRDAVKEALVAAVEARKTAIQVQAAVDLDRKLAERDREEFRAVVLLLDRLTVKVDSLVATGDQVASNLADAHRRADETNGAPGEAGDAAVQQTASERKRP